MISRRVARPSEVLAPQALGKDEVPKGEIWVATIFTAQITKTKPSEAVLFWRGRIMPPVDMFRLAGTYGPTVLF